MAVEKTDGGNAAFHNFHNDFAHVQDPNERRRLALAEVDKAPFGWYHVRAILVAGVGFFTDSYDIFAVSLLTTMLGIVYFPGVGSMPTSSDTAIKLATSAGTVIGQLGFGALADIVGRKRMYGLELMVIIFATLAQALASNSPSIDIIGIIIFWRVLMVSIPVLRFLPVLGDGGASQLQKPGELTDIHLRRVSVSVVTTLSPPSSPPSSLPPSGVVP